MTTVGEGNKKRGIRQELLGSDAKCCFCGGERYATTIDHQPPICFFSNRQRPRGLEVPACQMCNRGTSDDEQVAAALSRIYSKEDSANDAQELGRLVRSIERRLPGFLNEIQARGRDLRRLRQHIGRNNIGGILRLSGPIVENSVSRFSAKLGLALYFSHTGIVLTKSGGVLTRCFTNVDIIEGNVPKILRILEASPQMLRQGRHTSQNQFEWQSWILDQDNRLAFFATFRHSFAIFMWCEPDRYKFPEHLADQVIIPGFIDRIRQ